MNNTMTEVAEMNVSHFRTTATLLEDGRVLVAGSLRSDNDFATELYDPEQNTWTLSGELNVARYTHKTVRLPGGKVLVVGGYNPIEYKLASTELWDPDTGTWSYGGELIMGRDEHTITMLDDRIMVIGGRGPMGTTGNVEIFFMSE